MLASECSSPIRLTAVYVSATVLFPIFYCFFKFVLLLNRNLKRRPAKLETEEEGLLDSMKEVC